ncbi:MAG: EscU/YscU/HrcU family type III secretion system export apparatus switch protein [Armatimonadetes bacterium]|nr:MAG: EscU/YscU/HrcU family type III secretion system export apparatus switch protein [Armatimonadota bacterium]
MPDTSQERTEQATPRKRQRVRREGTVAKSTDLTTAGVFLALAVGLPLAFGGLAYGILQTMQNGLAPSATTLSLHALSEHLAKTMGPAGIALLPVLFLAMGAGVATSLAQVGFHLSAEPLAPKFNRINPIEGFKRLLSRRSFFELAKTLAKLGILGWIAWKDLSSNWDELLALATLPPLNALAWVGGFLSSLLLKVAMLWVVIGILDYAFQRRQVEKEIMMTRDELKRELKETEFSPELRAELARRRRALARARQMASVKKADVVVTNPLEYAVALKYDEKKMAAPVVVAKGRHRMADRIRDEAKKHRVPIVPNPPLARTLYKEVEVGSMIPPSLYQAVAEILAVVFRSKSRR